MLLAAPAARRCGECRLPWRGRLKVAIPAPVQRVDVPATLNEPFAAARRAPMEGPWCADSEEKREPVSDIDIAVADSLKVLDLKRPIREADI